MHSADCIPITSDRLKARVLSNTMPFGRSGVTDALVADFGPKDPDLVAYARTFVPGGILDDYDDVILAFRNTFVGPAPRRFIVRADLVETESRRSAD
jgi:hypothetical protein